MSTTSPTRHRGSEMIEPAQLLPDDGDRVAPAPPADPIATVIPSRVYKKTSPNSKMTMYLINRDLAINGSKVEPLVGVVLLDPDYLKDRKVFGQLTLMFRYGREDEEVMGLKFCNEAILCLEQLFPPWMSEKDRQTKTTPVQEALIHRLGPNAYAFTLEVACIAPPSVQLIPAKEYRGAPIGTSYEVRAYVGDRPDERVHKRNSVRMALRLIQYAPLGGKEMSSPPHASFEKPFLLSEGRVGLEAHLDKQLYFHDDPIEVRVNIVNKSNKSVRKIKVFIVQHVDVCMFSNGKFKNVVASVESQEGCPVAPGSGIQRSYSLQPVKGATKNWVAVEDSYFKDGGGLASSVMRPSCDDRNVFAIYVSYYVKVKAILGAMGGVVAVKLPFLLMHPRPAETDSNCASPMILAPPPAVSGHRSSLTQQERIQNGDSITPAVPCDVDVEKIGLTVKDEDVEEEDTNRRVDTNNIVTVEPVPACFREDTPDKAELDENTRENSQKDLQDVQPDTVATRTDEETSGEEKNSR